ncbi:DUF1493 family protein [Yoonia maritima]|uniref:DUF1493 family protein n=1 Tax=Yoonia maritima TaxID=1435347 RepID=UPI000D110630|nr:DUF1493 family protein [Yoonia maritima]
MGRREEILEHLSVYNFRGQDSFDLSDVFIGNGIEGDDANELIDDFAKRFDVDMGGFLYYFHYVGDEPPGHRRVLPIDRHGQVYPFIPVSLDILTASAEAGKWILAYPDHEVRTSLRSKLVLFGFLTLLAVLIIDFIWRTFITK